jgi:putative ABC transport system permease protein
MLAAVFGVLLIACANVTSLQLARAADRMREVAVRTALGASRGRIIRQILVEGLVLSVLGAAGGLAIATIGIRLFNWGIADTAPPFWIDVRIDTVVLGFVLAITLLATLASSLVPALRVSRQNVNEVLKDEGRASTGLRIGRTSRLLVIGEMTFSFCLLVVSGLLMKGLVVASSITYPFEVDRMFTARLQFESHQYPTSAEVRQATARLLSAGAAVPGVRAFALATGRPDGGGRAPVEVEGRPAPVDGRWPLAKRIAASPEYFAAIGVPITEGRAFSASDRNGALAVAVVGDDFVRKFFPKGDALGKRIRVGREDQSPWRTIVGIVPSLAVRPQPGSTSETVYLPLDQTADRVLLVFAATAGPPMGVTDARRQAVASVDRGLPLFEVDSLRGVFNRQMWPYRVFGGLFMTFGLAALVLAASGLYGVMSFGVRRRTPEIGLRMALGAERAGVVRMIVRQGLTQVAIGMVLGLLLGHQLARQLTLLLLVSPWDPTVFGLATGVLLASGLLASLVPALRAASVDPLVALRHD